MNFLFKVLFSKHYEVVASRRMIKGGVYSGQRDSLNAWYSYS